MDEYYARRAAEERSVTRILLGVWIAEMVWVSFFALATLLSGYSPKNSVLMRRTAITPTERDELRRFNLDDLL